MKRSIVFPDYTNSLINLMASIKHYYGLAHDVPTLPMADAILNKKYTNVILMVLDGLGSYVLDKSFKKPSSFLHSKKVGDFLSVFPPTTTAAINSILSTKSPLATGWIGWHQYFKSIDNDIILFKNSGYYDETYHPNYPVANQELPYESILDMLPRVGTKTSSLHPAFREGGAENFNEFCQRVSCFCRGQDRKFLYAYWDEPDSTLHQYGVGSKKVKQLVDSMNERILKLYEEMDDETLIMIIADHGHANIKNLNLARDNEIKPLLTRKPSIEARATTFFVKEEYRFIFKQIFNHKYGQHFKLVDRHEIEQLGLFGPGVKHPRFDDFFGDYLAIAVDYYAFFYQEGVEKHKPFKATHAGMLAEEMVIPLIILKRD